MISVQFNMGEESLSLWSGEFMPVESLSFTKTELRKKFVKWTSKVISKITSKNFLNFFVEFRFELSIKM